VRCKVISAKFLHIADGCVVDWLEKIFFTKDFSHFQMEFFRFSGFRCKREMPCIPRTSRIFRAAQPSEARNRGTRALLLSLLRARRTLAAFGSCIL